MGEYFGGYEVVVELKIGVGGGGVGVFELVEGDGEKGEVVGECK